MIHYTDESFTGIIKFSSHSCGEFNWTTKWVHGLISNYTTYVQVFAKLQAYSSEAHKGRQKWFNKSSSFLLSRYTWPRCMFVSSVYNSYWPVREALSFGIPCFGVADTNTLCNFVTIPMPGNDESMDCLVFYNDSVANFILGKKFLRVISWFYSSRRAARLPSFKKWVLQKWSINGKIAPKQAPLATRHDFRLNSNKYRYLGMNFLLSRNVGFNTQSGYLTIFDKAGDAKMSTAEWCSIIRGKSAFLQKLLTLRALRNVWMAPRIIAINRNALISDIRSFVTKRLITKKLFRNNLWKFFHPLRYVTQSQVGSRRSYSRYMLKIALRNRSKWSNSTLFSARFRKYLLYYRYFEFKALDFFESYPLRSKDVFSHYYIKIMANQFVADTQLDSSINALPLRSLRPSDNNNWITSWFKKFSQTKFLGKVQPKMYTFKSSHFTTQDNLELKNSQMFRFLLLLYLKYCNKYSSFAKYKIASVKQLLICLHKLSNKYSSQTSVFNFYRKRVIKYLKHRKFLIFEIVLNILSKLPKSAVAGFREFLIKLFIVKARKKFNFLVLRSYARLRQACLYLESSLNNVKKIALRLKAVTSHIEFLSKFKPKKNRIPVMKSTPLRYMIAKKFKHKSGVTLSYVRKVVSRFANYVGARIRVNRRPSFKRSQLSLNKSVFLNYIKCKSYPLHAFYNAYNPSSKYYKSFINNSGMNYNIKFNRFFIGNASASTAHKVKINKQFSKVKINKQFSKVKINKQFNMFNYLKIKPAYSYLTLKVIKQALQLYKAAYLRRAYKRSTSFNIFRTPTNYNNLITYYNLKFPNLISQTKLERATKIRAAEIFKKNAIWNSVYTYNRFLMKKSKNMEFHNFSWRNLRNYNSKKFYHQPLRVPALLKQQHGLWQRLRLKLESAKLQHSKLEQKKMRILNKYARNFGDIVLYRDFNFSKNLLNSKLLTKFINIKKGSLEKNYSSISVYRKLNFRLMIFVNSWWYNWDFLKFFTFAKPKVINQYMMYKNRNIRQLNKKISWYI